MRKSFIYCACVMATIMAWGLGCNGSGSPSWPDIHSPGSLKASNGGLHGSSEILWGLFDISIDPLTGSVEIVPLRGVMFEVNVTKFLQPPFVPTNHITLALQPETNLATGYIAVNVGIQHPNPSSNLRGFDVMGIFMASEGGYSSQFEPGLTWPSPDDARLLNADGYTRWWNQVEFTSINTVFGYTEGVMAPHGFSSTCMLNPFKYFANGLGPDDPWDPAHLGMTDRGSFDTTTPGSLARRYEIQFPPKKATDYRFKYAVSASWAPPYPGTVAPGATADFPVTCSQSEACQISITDIGSNLWYHSPSDYGGDIHIRMAISNWQFALNGPSAVLTTVIVESPTLFTGPIDVFNGTEWWMPPDIDHEIDMMFSIYGATPTTVTNQELLFSVVNKPPFDFSGQPGGAYPDSALAAYQVWTVPVESK